MASRVTFRIRDFGGEYSSFSIPGLNLTAANLVAQQALIASLQAAVAAIVIGNIAEETVLLSRTTVDDTNPDSPFAQREIKWLVTYTDTVTGKIHQAEIPTAQLSELVPGSELLDVSAASAGEDFVTAFEAFVRAEGANAVNVDSIRLVGRNL